MALIPPFFLDCVVAIGFDKPDGTRSYAATGFLYGKFVSSEGDNKRYAVFLVTNKHVFRDAQVTWLRFNPEGDEPAREFDLRLVDDKNGKLWLEHPDPVIDLAVIAINTTFLKEQGIRFSFFGSDQHVIGRSQALEVGISEGDGVFVLGFPMGLVGEKRNSVIVRQGTIARIRDYLVGSANEFLVDTSIFPGNSGGPVVSRPEVVAIQGTTAVGRACLLGVVASYVPYQDVAISIQTQRPRIIFEENSGLAAIVPVDFLNEIISNVITGGKIPPEPPVEVSSSTPEQPPI